MKLTNDNYVILKRIRVCQNDVISSRYLLSPSRHKTASTKTRKKYREQSKFLLKLLHRYEAMKCILMNKVIPNYIDKYTVYDAKVYLHYCQTTNNLNFI